MTWAAGLALLLSVLSLTWQLTLHRLIGPRWRVRVNVGVCTHRGLRTYGRRWPKLHDDFQPVDANDLWVEVAEIEVANIGRTVGWVSKIGLDFGREPWWRRHFRREPWWRRRTRRTMTVRPLVVNGSVADGVPVRLEPGQFVTMVVPFVDSVAWACCDRNVDRVPVRASAFVGGGRSTRSGRILGWRTSGKEAKYPHLTAKRNALVFRALLDSWPTSDVSGLYGATVDTLVALDGPEPAALADALTTYFDPITAIRVAAHLQPITTTGEQPPPTSPGDVGGP